MNTQELIALITVLAPLAVSVAGALYKHLLERLPSSQRSVLAGAASLGVVVADQVGGELSNTEKKAKAMQVVNGIIGSSLFPGRKLPPAVVDAVIEATVASLHDGQQKEAQDAEQPTSQAPVGFQAPASSGNL